MDKNIKQGKADRARQEEAALNRVLLWLIGGAGLEFLLLLLNRFYTNYTIDQLPFRIALGTAVKVAAVGTLGCAVVLAGYWRTQRRQDKPCLWSGAGVIFLLGLSAGCFSTWLLGENGLRFAYVGVPVVIVLVLVYYLYQREFFFQSCCAALSLLGIWIVGRGLGSYLQVLVFLYVIGAVVLMIAGAFLCRKAQEKQGKVSIQGRTVQLFPKDASYPLLYAGVAVNACALTASLFSLPSAALYGVAVAWVLVMAVYYTVKLM